VKPQAKDDCSDVTVTQDGPPETVDVLCDTAYTEYYTFTAVDDCGNTADYVKTLVIVDDTPPELVVDDMYCLFPTYGEKFGLWAVYDLSWLFRHEDNCDGNPLTAGSFHCNATDWGSVVTGVVPDTQCKIMNFNSVWKVFIKIDRHTDGPATHMGRTYSIYGEIGDSCGNHWTRKREVFIPVSQAVYEHYQPCDTGNPEYETALPITYTGFDDCTWYPLTEDECPEMSGAFWEDLKDVDCHEDMADGELCDADGNLPDGQFHEINNCDVWDIWRCDRA